MVKCVYLHINETGIFYVGCGSKRRPWMVAPRSILWKQVAGNGYSVMTLGEFKTKQEAWELEKVLIAHFNPRCNISTGGSGGSGFIRSAKTRDKIRVSRLGEKHPKHKLTEKQVLAIREDTRSLKLISMDYEVSLSLISLIKTRRTWKHI